MADRDSRYLFYGRYVSTHTHQTRAATGAWHPVLEYLPHSPNVVLLDLGCGAGDLLAAAKGRGVRHVHGLDVSGEQVRLAHALGREYVRQANLLDFLPHTDLVASCITTVDLLEHLALDEVLDAARAIAAHLPPGGLWIGQVPNAVSPFFGNYAYGDLTHRSVFTASSIRQLHAIVDLETLVTAPVGVAPGGGVYRAMRRGAFRFVSALLKASLAAETGGRDHIVTQNLIFVAQKPHSSS